MDRAFHLGLPAPERLDVGASCERHLRVFRHATELAHEVLAGARDIARLPSDRARHVILPSQLVEDRATNARYGEGAEREAASSIERLDRRHEADRAGAHQLVEVRLHGETPGELPRDVMDEIQILAKDGIACEIISGCGPGPEGTGIHGRLGHRGGRRGGAGGPARAFEAGGVAISRGPLAGGYRAGQRATKSNDEKGSTSERTSTLARSLKSLSDQR